eukprot:g21734.t1
MLLLCPSFIPVVSSNFSALAIPLFGRTYDKTRPCHGASEAHALSDLAKSPRGTSVRPCGPPCRPSRQTQASARTPGVSPRRMLRRGGFGPDSMTGRDWGNSLGVFAFRGEQRSLRDPICS